MSNTDQSVKSAQILEGSATTLDHPVEKEVNGVVAAAIHVWSGPSGVNWNQGSPENTHLVVAKGSHPPLPPGRPGEDGPPPLDPKLAQSLGRSFDPQMAEQFGRPPFAPKIAENVGTTSDREVEVLMRRTPLDPRLAENVGRPPHGSPQEDLPLPENLARPAFDRSADLARAGDPDKQEFFRALGHEVGQALRATPPPLEIV